MNMFLLNGTREALRNELRRLDAIKPGCGNCTHFDLEKCKVFEQSPPAEWFKGPVECEAWEFDHLPFASASPYFDMVTRKARRMARY